MGKDFDYVTVADVLAFHSILIKRYGGTDGVRDMGALESALFRPQTGYYADLLEEAAALLESLAMNHPFIDGNKRVAFAVTDAFLRINGFALDVTNKEIYKKFMELFEAGNFTFEYLEPWLRGVTRPASAPN